jgi:filamentous hemagglutinin family protein
VGRRGLRLAEIERRILLAGDTYGVALGSALQAGASPGGTVVVLDPEYRGVTGFVGLDNSLSDALGTWKLDGGIEVNGVLGLGESIYGRVSGHPGRLQTLTFGAVAPVGRNGLTVNVEAVRSETDAEEDGPDLPSEFERAALRLFYPWIRSRDFNLTTRLAFDAQDDRLDIDDGDATLPVYEDSSRVARLAADAFWLTEGQATVEVGAELSFGLDCCGARTADDAGGGTPLSREGADAEFTKLVLSGRARVPFGEDMQLTVNGRAQTSFGEPLLVAEQFGLASPREISPLDAGTLLGDSGWVLRGELARRWETEAGDLPLSVAPFVFAATGRVSLEQPGADERGETGASAVGGICFRRSRGRFRTGRCVWSLEWGAAMTTRTTSPRSVLRPVSASERAVLARLGRLARAAALGSTALCPLVAQAEGLPSGGRAVSGAAEIGAPESGRMTVTQTGPRAVVNWESFSVGAGNRVDFAQPGRDAAILNRVTGPLGSRIDGTVSADGRVFLVNPSGVVVGPTGRVEAGGFVGANRATVKRCNGTRCTGRTGLPLAPDDRDAKGIAATRAGTHVAPAVSCPMFSPSP